MNPPVTPPAEPPAAAFPLITLILDPRFPGFRGFVFDPNGNIVVTDKVNSAIRLVLP